MSPEGATGLPNFQAVWPVLLSFGRHILDQTCCPSCDRSATGSEMKPHAKTPAHHWCSTTPPRIRWMSTLRGSTALGPPVWRNAPVSCSPLTHPLSMSPSVLRGRVLGSLGPCLVAGWVSACPARYRGEESAQCWGTEAEAACSRWGSSPPKAASPGLLLVLLVARLHNKRHLVLRAKSEGQL